MSKDIQIDIKESFGASFVREQRFAVYIPNKDKNGNRVAQDAWVTEALRLLSSICGGATAMPPVKGAWLNDDTNELIVEEPVLVYSFIEPATFAKRLKEVVALVHQIGKETNQGQMAIEFDQTFFLIDIATNE